MKPIVSISREPKPLITTDMAKTSEIVLQITLFSASSIFGIMTNILNLIVYWKQGLKSSINVGLFALSVSDLFVVIFPLFTAVSFALDNLYVNPSIKFSSVSAATLVQLRNMFYSISSTITAFLSIERCLCVTRPLRVKNIFTRRRTVVSITAIFLFYILGWVPKFYGSPLGWRKLESRNFSYVFTIWYHPAFDYLEGYHNSVMTIFLPTVCQVVITCTAAIMIRGLRKASKFRQEATRTKVQGEHAQPATDSGNSVKALDEDKRIVTDSRDARLVKTMVALVTILSIANVPYVALEYAQLFELELRPGKLYQNLFRILFGTVVLLGTINASVNTFVYYNIGSRYRKVVNDMLCAKK